MELLAGAMTPNAYADTFTRVPLPDFVLIGAEKAGTTFLVRRLMEHPQVFMPSPTRTQLVADPLDERSLRDWEALFRDVPPNKIKGMRGSRYFARPGYAEFLYAKMPWTRLIVILRHPIARTISAYFHRMKLGVLPVAPVNVGLSKLLDGGYDTCYMCRAVVQDSLYASNLARVLEYFPQDQLLILLLDEFERDTGMHAREELGRLYRFVGATDDFTPQTISKKENAGSYSLARVHVWRAYRQLWYTCSCDSLQIQLKHPSRVQRIMASLLRRIDEHGLRPLLKPRAPALAPALAERLLELYRPEVEQLEPLLNRRLDSWKTWQTQHAA